MKRLFTLFLVTAFCAVVFATIPPIEDPTWPTAYPDAVEVTAEDGMKYQVVLDNETMEATIVHRNAQWGKNLSQLDWSLSDKGGFGFMRTHYYYNQTANKSITIPSHVVYNDSEYTVTRIGPVTFGGCEQLKKVVVPNTVQIIEKFAFCACTSLTEIILPEGLEEIGEYAFVANEALKNIAFPSTLKEMKMFAFGRAGLEKVELPEGLEVAGKGTFHSNANLVDVKLSETLVNIPDWMFMRGSKLKSIDLHEYVETIGDGAFAYTEIRKINIPYSTTYVNPTAFTYDNLFVEYEVDEKNPVYADSDGMLVSKDKKTLFSFPYGRGNDMNPANLTPGISELNNIGIQLLPSSIENIQYRAFYLVPNLSKLVIPNKVVNIEERVFDQLQNLTEITFLCESKPTIHSNAFYNNTKSPNVKVRRSLKDSWTDKIVNTAASAATLIPSVTTDDGTDEYVIVNGQAQLVSTTRDVYSLILPKTVEDCPVSRIGDYVFESGSVNSNPNIKEVIAFGDIDYVGASAFGDGDVNLFMVDDSGTDTDVVFATDKYKLDQTTYSLPENYDEFAGSGQNIFVKKSVCEDYKTGEWSKYADEIDYRIKDISISKKYGTFSREFDADLYDCRESGGSEVYAFTSGVKVKGAGDYGPETEYCVGMRSIFEGDAEDIDGVYVPKNTGVMLKCMDAEGTNSDFYYTIGEKNLGAPAGNVMSGMTEKLRSVVSDGSIYVMSGGQYHKVPASKSVTIPVHKAYLNLADEVPSGAKVSFIMDYTDIVTGIDEREHDGEEVIYNLNGMKVDAPQRGIYVKNGRKIVIK